MRDWAAGWLTMGAQSDAPNISPPPPPAESRVAARLHPHIKVLTRHDELPGYTKVLSAPGGELAASESQRKVFAILDLGAKQVCVVWTNLFADRTHYMWIKAQCGRAAMGYHIVETMEASPDLIELFYSAATNETVTTPTRYRGREDEMFDQIVVEALEEDASNIHWQIDEADCNIFFRIHGQMKFHKSFPRKIGVNLSRAAFTFTDEQSRSGAAAFNESETLLSASMTREVIAHGKPTRVELLWESHPTYPDGWDITQRLLLLGQDSDKLDFAKLGYSDSQIEAIVQACQARDGLILVVGATGSGKSTTLSAIAGRWLEYHQNRKKLMTISDPVEFVLKGARQINVTSRINKDGSVTGMGIEAALRTALRSNPDAIEVGEITSEQTAQLVQRAGNAGHLVLSTLPAMSPFGAIARLLEMGLSSSVLADGFLRLIIYQALIPTLCEACRKPWGSVCNDIAPIVREQVERHFNDDLHGIYTQSVDGCPRCKHMGITGRTAVAEMLVPDRELRNLIPLFKSEESNARLMAYAYWRAGLSCVASEVQGKTCMDQAMEKIRAGIACPINVQKELGFYDDQTKPEEERAFYRQLPHRL
ncbi:MAG: ATPase, T2SS/T4P/T4SS family [Luteimonas sp.]